MRLLKSFAAKTFLGVVVVVVVDVICLESLSILCFLREGLSDLLSSLSFSDSLSLSTSLSKSSLIRFLLFSKVLGDSLVSLLVVRRS